MLNIWWYSIFPHLLAERQDSIEADSIVKSAKNADSDSASALGTDKSDTLLGQQNAVAGSLDHLADTVVTSAKTNTITDPEQAFTQGVQSFGLLQRNECCSTQLQCNTRQVLCLHDNSSALPVCVHVHVPVFYLHLLVCLPVCMLQAVQVQEVHLSSYVSVSSDVHVTFLQRQVLSHKKLLHVADIASVAAVSATAA